ncbi:MAG: c-type cytochrome [Proteobacteria bacterium]|nr:c-type cytochrome [Pseudomonadota bacterium]
MAIGPARAQAISADAAQGRQIATQGTPGVPACAGCHGAQGEGNAAFPRLGGTGVNYLRRQLDAFADGSRKNAVMQPFAQQLSSQERAVVALYYSQIDGLAPPPKKAAASPDDKGAWLAERGRWANGVPACGQCHGPGGVGVVPDFPPLAGLPAAYISAQLQAWKSGTRPPGPLGLMAGVATTLSDTEIDTVANYYASLATGPQTTAQEGKP